MRRAAWLAMAVPAVLAVSTVVAVAAAYSAVPFQDQWATIWWWREIQRNGLTFSYLVSQHNEHRILLPRLVFLADLKWFRGSNVLNLVTIAAIQAAGVLLFLRAGFRRGGLAVLGAALAASLIVSLAQWENFFWGFQVQAVAVAAAGAWAIYLYSLAADQPDRRVRRLAAAVVLLAVATYSMANGLLAGAAMVLAGAVARRDLRGTLVMLAATLVLAALYLWGYQPVAQHSPASAALQDPAGFTGYVLAYLGNIWALGIWSLAMAEGLVGVVLTAAMTVLVFRDRGRDPVQAAMFGIVLFMGMTAGATALGRLSLGIEMSLSSRYATGSCYFWAAQAMFWSLHVQAWRPVFRTALGAALLAGMLGLFAVQRVHGPGLREAHGRMVAGAAAMRAGATDEAALRLLYPEPSRVAEFTPFLKAQRLSIFAEDGG
jgi:hypothetical protein